MGSINWTVSKQVGSAAMEWLTEAQAQASAKEYGGTVRQIGCFWYNIWPKPEHKSYSFEHPEFRPSVIGQF